MIKIPCILVAFTMLAASAYAEQAKVQDDKTANPAQSTVEMPAADSSTPATSAPQSQWPGSTSPAPTAGWTARNGASAGSASRIQELQKNYS